MKATLSIISVISINRFSRVSVRTAFMSVNVDVYERTGRYLRLLKIKLQRSSGAEKVCDDSFDYVTTWQLVSMMVCSLYSELLGSYCEAHMGGTGDMNNDSNNNSNDKRSSYDSNNNNNNNNRHGDNGDNEFRFYGDSINNSINNNNRSTQNTQSTQYTHTHNTQNHPQNTPKEALFLSLLTDHYDTLLSILAVLTVRVRYTRSAYISEYVPSLASISERIAHIENYPRIKSLLHSKSVKSDNIRILKTEISELLLSLAGSIRDAGRSW